MSEVSLIRCDGILMLEKRKDFNSTSGSETRSPSGLSFLSLCAARCVSVSVGCMVHARAGNLLQVSRSLDV